MSGIGWASGDSTIMLYPQHAIQIIQIVTNIGNCIEFRARVIQYLFKTISLIAYSLMNSLYSEFTTSERYD